MASSSATPESTGETFRIHYFANASTYTDKVTESLPAPLPVHKLFDFLDERYPGIKEKVLMSCMVSVALQYVDVDGESPEDKARMILPGQEVAIIPPVSSG